MTTTSRSPLRTPLCDLLGVEHPIMQAGMGLIARGKLAAAVSEAGGVGVIGSAQLTIDELREEIRIAKRLTDKPFGVDILFARVDTEGAEVVRYTHEVEQQIEVTLAERVPILISGLGNPINVVEPAHELGITVMSVVGNSRQAVKLVSQGVDAIIGQGHEAGGHNGRVGTAALIPRLVDAVDVPVVAAGGLSDGRGLVASLAFGASGVWMGTRFIVTEEAHAHDNYKLKIAAIDEEGTVVTRAHSGKPVRLIRNGFTAEWDAKPDAIEPFPLQMLHVGQPASALGRIEGDVDRGSLPAGQGAGLISAIKPAGQVVADIVEEATVVLARLGAPAPRRSR